MAKQKIGVQEAERETPNSKKQIQRAKEIFERHNIDMLFFTVDGYAFFKKSEAATHAQRLERKEITTINRKEI